MTQKLIDNCKEAHQYFIKHVFKKHSPEVLVIALVVILSVIYFAVRAPADFSGGTGTSSDPYIISTCTELQDMNNNLSASYKLSSDIDCSDTVNWNSGAGFAPVGQVGGVSSFTGNLDGNGKKITGLFINNTPGVSNIGLFGYFAGTVSNVGLENINITGGDVGGLAGASCGIISKSYVTGSVSGGGHIGGLVGYTCGGSISDSYSIANVTSTNSGDQVGGFVGRHVGGTISNSYSTGSVSGISVDTGGFVGFSSASIVGSFWDTETSGQLTSAGGTGKTTAEMKTQSTFTSAGWDFTTIWNIDGVTNNGYPFLLNIILAGSGTPSDPYIITNCSGLQSMGDDSSTLSKSYKLANDIDCSATSGWNSGAGFAPVGNTSTRFTGTFNGNGKKITGLYINRPEADYVALFGYTESGSTISNVGVQSADITGGASFTGGLVGYNSATITNSYTTGSITGIADSGYIGGLVGYNSFATIINSYSTSSVTDGVYIGGLVGVNNAGTITNSFWDIQTSGQASGCSDIIGNCAGLIGKTTTEMKTQSTFTDVNWNFTAVWDINGSTNDGYPFFRSVILPCITSITFDNPALLADSNPTITITFDEPVVGFDNTDIITIENGTLSDVSSSDGGMTWTASFIPTPGIIDATNIITVDATGVTDSSSNVGVGTLSSNNYTINTIAPSAPNAPTASAGPDINSTEENASFDVVVGLGSSGSAAGDTLELLLDGSSFNTLLTALLSDDDITSGTVAFNIVHGQLGEVGLKNITAKVTNAAGNIGSESPALSLNLLNEVILDLDNTAAVINSLTDITITVPVEVNNATVDVSSLITGLTGAIPKITINSSTSAGNVNVEIPIGSTVTGDDGWTGIIHAPTVESISSVTVPGGNVQEVIELGFDDIKLTFDKGVRINISGQASKRVGYSRNNVFTEIISTCADDSQATGDGLAAEGDCKIDVGSDLIIWTKHFTKFTTYTSSSSGGTSGGYLPGYGPNAVPIPVVAPILPLATAQMGGNEPLVPIVYSAPKPVLSQYLSLGSRDEDVRALQIFLNGNGFILATTGPGSPGNETDFFGPLTQSVLSNYQASVGLPANGLFGPLTRAAIKKQPVFIPPVAVEVQPEIIPPVTPPIVVKTETTVTPLPPAKSFFSRYNSCRATGSGFWYCLFHWFQF